MPLAILTSLGGRVCDEPSFTCRHAQGAAPGAFHPEPPLWGRAKWEAWPQRLCQPGWKACPESGPVAANRLYTTQTT